MSTRAVDDPGGAEVVENARLGRSGKTLIQRHDRVTTAPGSQEGVDEVGPAGQVNCHQVGHGK
jgi:hypothetical protein